MLGFGERHPRPHADRARPQLPLPGRDPRRRRSPASRTTSTAPARRCWRCAAPAAKWIVVAFATDRHEAQWVAGTIADALAEGIAPGEILVLARTGYATQPTQAALAAAGIPHRVLGNLGLYERAEVRDAMAYLALLANSADAQAFRRAVQSPRRGIGLATASRVVALARDEHDGDLITASTHARRARADPLARGTSSGSSASGRSSSACAASCAPGARSGTSSSPP